MMTAAAFLMCCIIESALLLRQWFRQVADDSHFTLLKTRTACKSDRLTTMLTTNFVCFITTRLISKLRDSDRKCVGDLG